MKLPCEQALWYVLPKIRADLAKELIKNGVSQKDTAELLGLTQSAVSQYVHKKRAGKIRTTKEYKERIKLMAEEIKTPKGKDKVSNLICTCCTASRGKDKCSH